ncbi:hypothetical protein, variant 2 [Exophiala sideris]|uniref:Uncharacterized protein n=1 Tax=Exophiala sideris TaxID=1016849 RepID=A0A0D1YXN1_9EURO|nr:hypothetical protein, variant 1 [Exophiala sideris]KIV86340.1 hypothetical protein, variant 2 [Exophiala sideris]
MRTFRALSDLWSVWRNEQVVHVPKNCSNVPIASFSVEFPTHLSWSQAGANLVDDRIQTNISDVRVLLLVQMPNAPQQTTHSQIKHHQMLD